ncbi:MAG: IS200/IS605 family transposase [Bacteroidetes bacterium]|nr:IS200/IS605 family transposase [Bacteroidota bacterium]
MPNTYTQIYIHIVFTVQGRQNLISESHREELQKYITGIVQNREQKLIAIYCMPDHIHIFVGFKPVMSISDLVREIKAVSSKFINDKRWIKGKFNWQEGYGAFSHSHSQIDSVVKYIRNQKEHHGAKSFKEEYLEMLNNNDVKYDDKYLFEWIE